jgi:hypothetical protein
MRVAITNEVRTMLLKLEALIATCPSGGKVIPRPLLPFSKETLRSKRRRGLLCGSE